MSRIKVKHYGNVGDKLIKEISETDLLDLGGLERCFGFRDYKIGLESGKISNYDEIRKPQGFVNSNGTSAYMWETYFAFDEKTLTNDSKTKTFNPRKVLRGVHWYLKK